jgi:hypothetical protein
MRNSLLVTTLALLSACHGASPERTATDYERERVRGDVAKARLFLTPADEALLSSGAAKIEDADLSTTGLPNTVVDSAHSLYDDGDSARVAVYMTGPNMQQAIAGLMQRAFAGERLDSADAKRSLRDVPRVTIADTVALRRSAEGWRVSAALPYRRALRDSLAYDIQLEEGNFLGGAIRGTVRNMSAAHFESLMLEVYDAKGESRMVDVGELAPHGVAKMFEMASLAPGRPRKVEVLSFQVSRTPAVR